MLIAVNAGNSRVLLGGYEEDGQVFSASIATEPKLTRVGVNAYSFSVSSDFISFPRFYKNPAPKGNFIPYSVYSR